MNMNLGRHLLYGAHNIDVCLPRVIRVDATLQADLRSTELNRLEHPAPQFLAIDVISLTPRCNLTTAFGKSTELATVLADVGVIDIAVDHVGNLLTDLPLAKLIRCLTEGIDVGAARAKQARHRFVVNRLLSQTGIQNRHQSAVSNTAGNMSHDRRRPGDTGAPVIAAD